MADVLGMNPYGPSVTDAFMNALGNMSNIQSTRARTQGQNLLNAFTQATQPRAIDWTNTKNALDTQFYGREKQGGLDQLLANIGLTQAQAKRENILANLPFGGQTLPGAAGQIQGLEMVRQMYGENSPQFQNAKQLFDLGMQSDQSRIAYQNALTQTIPIRTLTPLGKELVEQQQLAGGKAPTGSTWETILGYTPENSSAINQRAANLYNLKQQKETTDEDTRKRNLFAENMEKTLSAVNPDDLVRYAGIKNKPGLFIEDILSTVGKESRDYQNFRKSMQQMDMFAKQVRQFYGDSIQPQVQEGLKMITNPQSWNTNPDLAQQMYYNITNTVRNEMETYRSAAKGTDVYQGKNQPIITIPESFPSEQAKQNWLKSLTPEQYEYVKRKYMGGK